MYVCYSCGVVSPWGVGGVYVHTLTVALLCMVFPLYLCALLQQ